VSTDPGDRYFIVVVRGTNLGTMHALSRRDGGPDGTPYAGPWRLLTEDEALSLAQARNDDPREDSPAEAVEVYRFDNDPEWTEEYA
jgi:hypothetical protein